MNKHITRIVCLENRYAHANENCRRHFANVIEAFDDKRPHVGTQRKEIGFVKYLTRRCDVSTFASFFEYLE